MSNSTPAIEDKNICHNCVGESYLKEQMISQGRIGNCSYCGQNTKSFSIEDMAEFIETAFEQHYQRTLDHPTSFQYAMLKDKESEYDWERDGEPVVYAIMNAAHIPEEAASDIQRILDDKYFDFEAATMSEETEFSADSYYEERGPNDARWQDEWRNFDRSLLTESRFFNSYASNLLSSIFDGIDSMRTYDGQSLVVDAGPGTKYSSIFRARCFQSDDKLEEALARPDRHLGSPPSIVARSGRMNAHGISVFYGANTPEVALAEVRPPVGSKVGVARFDITRPLKLLDLNTLDRIAAEGSIFDSSYIDLLERTTFLGNLSRRIVAPVMPEHESFEYLSTQAIADFLATEKAPAVDGIIFPSAQMPGDALNIVLFQKAARVEDINIPKGTETSVHFGHMYDEGWEFDFTVIEERPSEKAESPDLGKFVVAATADSPFRYDSRQITLKIDLNSVHVHMVEAVQFKTYSHPVTRHVWKKDENPFS